MFSVLKIIIFSFVVFTFDRLSRTCGVSIFIDYCTAPATQRKMEGGERDIQLINVNEASSCFVDFLLQRRLVLKNHKSLR